MVRKYVLTYTDCLKVTQRSEVELASMLFLMRPVDFRWRGFDVYLVRGNGDSKYFQDG
jgi:hypothetical protein